MLEKVLTILHIFYTKQNTSDIITFPIKFENKDYYLYIVDCIKCLLQEILNQCLISETDITNILEQNNTNQTYKDYIIEYGPQLNKNIKEKLVYAANKIKDKYQDDFVYKLVTTDELFILTTLDFETVYKEIKNYFTYKVRTYKINQIAVNNIDYEMYVI
ncbi:MAG: hypothetical protein QXS19_06470 [Candidatus Methanomethylicia archaeon]